MWNVYEENKMATEMEKAVTQKEIPLAKSLLENAVTEIGVLIAELTEVTSSIRNDQVPVEARLDDLGANKMSPACELATWMNEMTIQIRGHNKRLLALKNEIEL
jgi:hypothetical protein